MQERNRRPPPPRPDREPKRNPVRDIALIGPKGWLWLTACALACFLGLMTLVALFRDRATDQPPLQLLFASGILVAAVSGVAVTAATSARSLPWRASIATGAAFMCIAIAKFTFGPLGLYDVNAERTVETLAGPKAVIVFGAPIVFGLYAAVVAIVYLVFVRRVRPEAVRAWVTPTTLALIPVVGAFAVGAAIVFNGSTYVEFVFTSAAAGALAIALASAAGLVAYAFGTTSRAAKAAGDASLLATLLWLTLAFLLVFQGLWVVYLLTLFGIWPFRTVTPK